MSENFLFNSLFNFLSVLTEIKSTVTPFSSVFLTQGSKQYLSPLNIFSLLPLLFTQPLIVDFSTDSNTDTFENLLLYFAYSSSSSSLSLLLLLSLTTPQSIPLLRKSLRPLPSSLYTYFPLFLHFTILWANLTASKSY
jgi:hypothetical protein